MEDEEIKMIPTRRRKKIPRALSYVADSKTLSLAFQDVPQFELLRLDFWCYRVTDALQQKNWPRLILTLGLSSPHTFFPLDIDLELVWLVRVDVCRRQDTPEVREWLETKGLNLAREWLLNKTGNEGQANRPLWNAYFYEETRDFSIKLQE